MYNAGLLFAELQKAKQVGSFPFNGFAFDSWAFGVAQGFCNWVPSGITLQGVATGLVGSGTIVAESSSIVVSSSPVDLLASLQGAGLVGPLSTSLAIVTSTGISNFVSTYFQYTSIVGGVGSGQDVSNIYTNSQSLITHLLESLSSQFGGGGLNLPSMASGLGIGICQQLSKAVGKASIVGAAGEFPASTSTVSRVV